MAKKEEEKKDDTAAAPDEETHEDDADAETEDDSEAENGSGDSDESDDDSDDDADSKNLDDWKKIAQDERDRRKKAEKALAEDRYKGNRRGSDDSDDADDSDGDDGKQTLTAAELRKVLKEEREATRKEVLSGRTKEIARELADSDAEAEAIVEIFNGRSFPDHLSHEEKVREAYFIAHGPRLLAKRDELRRSLKSKDTRSKGSNENAHRDSAKAGEPKLAPQDRAELSRLGFKWDGKRFSKKLSNGKNLVKDWKTKKVFVEG